MDISRVEERVRERGGVEERDGEEMGRAEEGGGWRGLDMGGVEERVGRGGTCIATTLLQTNATGRG